MTTALVARRFLVDYGRNPVNLLALVLIPLVFVVVAAGALVDAARLLGSGEEDISAPKGVVGEV